MTHPQPNRADLRRLVVLLALCGFLFFFQLGSRALWDDDEGLHAVIARNMAETGDWVTPTFNGEAFFDKPVLFNWLDAVSFELLGFTELAARLPSALLALACVLVTYLLGKRMFGSAAGFLAGSILATSALFLLLSRTVQYDMAFACCTTLALYFFYCGVVEEKRRRRYFLLFHVAVAFAVLAKGPLGVLLPALVIGPHLVWSRRLALLREMQIGWGLVIVIVIAAPWYLLMSTRHQDFLPHFLFGQNLGYFFSAESRHPRPFYFYLLVLPGLLFPWFGFLPLAIYRPLRVLRRDTQEATRLLLVWVVAIFLFFTLAASKLETYLLPLLPAAALLIARLWDEVMTTRSESLHKGLFWSHLPAVALMLTIAVLLWIRPPIREGLRYGVEQWLLWAVVLPVAALLVLSLWLFWKRRYAGSFAAILGAMAAALVVFTTLFVPVSNPYRSSKGIALELDSRLPPAEPLVFFGRLRDSALFYTGRGALVIKDPEELGRYFADGERALCLTEDRHLPKLEGLAESFRIVETRGDKFILSGRAD